MYISVSRNEIISYDISDSNFLTGALHLTFKFFFQDFTACLYKQYIVYVFAVNK